MTSRTPDGIACPLDNPGALLLDGLSQGIRTFIHSDPVFCLSGVSGSVTLDISVFTCTPIFGKVASELIGDVQSQARTVSSFSVAFLS